MNRDDPARSNPLRDYRILDSGPEPAYDAIADLARKVAYTPIASVSFFDDDRVWFKSVFGSSHRELPRNVAICARVVSHPAQPLVIPDTFVVPDLANNPLLHGDPPLRSYVAAALVTPCGTPIGAICAIDTVPRQFTPDEIQGIVQLAQQAMAQLELRKSNFDLEAMRDQATVASRAKSAFLANMSHEIRTPMNGILGLAALLKSTPLSATQNQFVDGIESSATNLMSVLSDVLEYSDLLADRTRLNLQAVDVHSLVDEVANVMKPAVTQRGLRFTSLVSHSVLHTILTDKLRLKQILLHLLDNAAKFTLEGTIELQVKAVGGSTRFLVKDTGIGIPEGMREAIHTPFTQIYEDAHRPYPGKGLGLSTVNELLRLMNSRLQVESDESWGSTFWFDLSGTAADASSLQYSADERAST